jgi:hypothetical protein
MDPTSIRSKAKQLGLRVTKDINGKRVKLSDKQIKKTVNDVLKIRASDTKKFIRVCRDVLLTAGGNLTRPTQTAPVSRMQIPRPRPPPPPPPPPPRPVNNKRAKLMNELKETLKKRSMKK